MWDIRTVGYIEKMKREAFALREQWLGSKPKAPGYASQHRFRFWANPSSDRLSV